MDDRWFRLGDHGRYTAMQLRKFSIRTLLVALTLIAASLIVVNQYIYETAEVGFSHVSTQKKSDPFYNPDEFDYYVWFTIQDGERVVCGAVGGEFGYNRFLDLDIEKANASDINGEKRKFRYRAISLPWLPATTAPDELAKAFSFSSVYPNHTEPPWK